MMAAPVKIGRALAAVMLADLPHTIAEAEEHGIAPPKVALKHGDRLSHADANTLYTWTMGQPDFRAALRDASNPAHGIARGFMALFNHFLHDHPQDANGEPAAWSEPLSPAIGGLLAGTREKIEAGELTPAEARDMIAWAQMQPDHAAALHDRRNPEHGEVVKEFQDLHARAFSDGAAAAEGSAAASGGTAQSSSPADATAQARLAELRAHPAFRDGRHPQHRDVIRELGELLAGGSAGTAGTAAPPAGAVSGIAAPATPKPGATAAPSAAPPPANRAEELVQSLRGNKFFGSTERRQALAALEAELLAGDGAASAAPPAGG